MIRRLRGTICEQSDTALLLDVHGVAYHVFVPPSIMQRLAERCSPQGEVELVTFHYQQLEPGRGYDVLIGFTNAVEREFFERFITVSGVGPKAALRALTVPIPEIARAIDEGNTGVLKSLPGIGEQRAKEIIAKLQGKVGKFALLQGGPTAKPSAPKPAVSSTVETEATAILLQLEYSRVEATEMVRAALTRNARIRTAEELLNEVYRQRSGTAVPTPPPPTRPRRPKPEPAIAAPSAAEHAEDPYAI